jgi:hypothetical protein
MEKLYFGFLSGTEEIGSGGGTSDHRQEHRESSILVDLKKAQGKEATQSWEAHRHGYRK